MSGPMSRSLLPALARSTSGRATAWPAIGWKFGGASGSSASLFTSACMLVIACSNGLGLSSRAPAYQRPCASRWISPDLTSKTRKPRSGWATHDVGLAVAEAPFGRGPAEPGDVLEEAVLGREGGPESIGHESLGIMALGHDSCCATPMTRIAITTSRTAMISTTASF